MAAYWLTYKPLSPAAPRGWPEEEMTGLVRRFNERPLSTTEWWRISAHQTARVGDRVYLFKQGNEPRGIFGVGEIVDGPELRDDPADREVLAHRAKILFQALTDPSASFLLRLDEISDIVLAATINAQSSGTRLENSVSHELDRRLSDHLVPKFSALDGGQADDVEFDPDSIDDERERAMRAIRIRRGQPAFRNKLLDAYSGICAATGCNVTDVLDAAHITPYLGPQTHDVSNGLLLRTDVHTLFDCWLISVDPFTKRIALSEVLKNSAYSDLDGRLLRRPVDDRFGPSRRSLEKHFTAFTSKNQFTSK